MVLSTRVAILFVALVVAVIVLSLTGILRNVSASSTNHTNNLDDSEEHSALTVLTKTREREVVDLGPQGASQADIRVTNAPLYNESAKEKIGRLDLFWVLTDPADQPGEKAHMAEVTATYTLQGGEISAQGLRAYPKLSGPPSEGVDAISGGTGKYAGVRGEVHIETLGEKRIITFHFID
jgi:hypothetical protein